MSRSATEAELMASVSLGCTHTSLCRGPGKKFVEPTSFMHLELNQALRPPKQDPRDESLQLSKSWILALEYF